MLKKMVCYKKSPKSWRVVNSATDPYNGIFQFFPTIYCQVGTLNNESLLLSYFRCPMYVCNVGTLLILWWQVIAIRQCVLEGMSNIAVMSSTWEFPIPSSRHPEDV